MNKSQIIFFVLVSIVAATTGWFVNSPPSATKASNTHQEIWHLPEQKSSNLTLHNSQLTQLEIWGKKAKRGKLPVKVAPKANIPYWRLVGITNKKEQLVALFEIKNSPGLKRVFAGEQITIRTKLISINEESIRIRINDNETTILLYP